MDHPGHADIPDIGTLPLDETRIFDTLDARTYITHYAAPFLALRAFFTGAMLWAATMDFTMFS